MLFQTLDFAVFFPLVFALYWGPFRHHLKAQNAFLVAASFFFYGWWDWQFLGLMILSAAFNFFIAIGIQNGKLKKTLLWLGVAANLGILGYFKYANFFLENFVAAFTLFGFSPEVRSLNLVLPIGISFYTLQAISYAIDVYRGRFQATRNIIAYFGYISFFPQLVAGPIERASKLIPQFNKPRPFDASAASDGLRRILLGLFMKVVVADSCTHYVHRLLYQPELYGSVELITGVLLYPVMAYADFAGYSEIAIGLAALLGFRLTRNFAFPFLSTDIAMLWRRWHITLTTWFRDYALPLLDKENSSKLSFILNISLIYVLSGLWHGARWNYVFWGVLNALFIAIHILYGRSAALRRKENDLFHIVTTYLLFAFALFFCEGTRPHNPSQYYLAIWNAPHAVAGSILMERGFLSTLLFVGLLFGFEWKSRKNNHALAFIASWPSRPLRWSAYLLILILVLIFSGSPRIFFYFQY